jgi:hypothetical protein
MKEKIKASADKFSSTLIAERLRSKIKIDADAAHNFRFKIAQEKDEFETACRLVHDQYVRRGYMTPNESGLRLSIWHALPEATTFIGKKDGQLVNTVTLFPDSPLGLPMDAAYKKELDQLRNKGRKIAEVGALATHPAIQFEDQTVLMHGNKILHTYSRDHLGVDDLVIAINPRHEWLYSHILLFEKIGDVTSYDYVKKAPAVAYRINLQSAAENYRAVYDRKAPENNLYRFFFTDNSACVELPDRNATVCFWDEEKIKYFFEEKTQLLKKAGIEINNSLKQVSSYFRRSENTEPHHALPPSDTGFVAAKVPKVSYRPAA